MNPLPVPAPETPPADQLTGGVHHLLSDRQVRAVGPYSESFEHYARQIVNEAGLEDASQLSVEFEPSFQRLTLHWVRLRRGGQWLDRLAGSKIEVLQREPELESRIYDGRLSVVLFLADVRVGDVLDYAYTTAGTNPIFKGRFLDSFSVDWSVPVHHTRFRLLWPRQRHLVVRNHGTRITPSTQTLGGDSELIWERRDPPPVLGEDRLPKGFDTWGWVQLSEFQTWAEVADWGRDLFPIPQSLPKDLEARVEEWRRASADPAERALQALRFVQDEVRYMGFEMGENSHRPSAPDAVFRRRYGDCKDKSLLLSALLARLGVESAPALLSTGLGTAVDEWQSSPLAFNHAVVRVRLNGRELWLDPTIGGQGGALEATYFPPYGRALVLEPGTEALTPIPDPRLAAPSVLAREVFTAKDFDGAVELTVETEYRGPDADSLRRDFQARSRDEITTSYQKYYAQLYPQARSLGPVTFTDDRQANLARVKERYTLPDFWSPAEGDPKRLQADVHPSAIESVVPKKILSPRGAPIGLRHPVKVRHITEVLLPQDWNIAPEDSAVDDGSLRFRFKSSYQDRRLTLVYDYETLRAAVPLAEVNAHRRALQSIHDHMAYEVTPRATRYAATNDLYIDLLPRAEGPVNWQVVVVGLCLVPLALVGGVHLYRHRPPAPPETAVRAPSLAGLGGWLIPLGLLLVTFIVHTTAELWGGSRRLTLGESLPTPAVLLGLLGQVLLLVGALILTVLFLQQRRSFPRALLLFIAFRALVLLAAALWERDLPGPHVSVADVLWRAFWTLAPACAFIPYLALSDRSRSTLVR